MRRLKINVEAAWGEGSLWLVPAACLTAFGHTRDLSDDPAEVAKDIEEQGVRLVRELAASVKAELERKEKKA